MSAFAQPLIALVAGGTGGHMFPAEALAQELKRRGYRILLVTDRRGARYAANFPADEQFLISAATPSVGGPIAKGAAALSIAFGLFTSLKEFKKRQPVAAVGFGGYPSLPAMKAAALMGVPYGVHEQNGVLGRANRLLAKDAAFVAHAFPVLAKLPAGVEGVEVGNPIRDAVAAVRDAPLAAVDDGAEISVLVFGGSQGASILSLTPIRAFASLPADLRARLCVTHQVREQDDEAARAAYAEAGVKHEIAPFFEDLPQRMARAHLVISRAGASTVTELSAIGRPSILVPLAIAMDDHQTGNANVLSKANAAIILPEKTFSEDSLAAALTPLLVNPGRLQSMAAAAKGTVKSGAAAALADLVGGLRSVEAAA
ncbi:MAG: UDP-N-acetylglucosamine--N-acetylmuramyl-(pentapeptide) pyrophosphoryl-undecaprenol N-acetylglucosamine transferase [Hyphococcus sp.]